MKVHIIGLPSAGKTTLATDLAARLGVPYHGLDPIAFVDEEWTLRPAPERDAMVAQILAEPGFVTEGGFLGWTDALFAAASHIVWLDPPLRVLIWRHIRRVGLRHPWWLAGRLRFQVLSYTRAAGSGPAKDDPNQTRAGTEAALAPWADKVIRQHMRVGATQLAGDLRRLSPVVDEPFTHPGQQGQEDSPREA